MLNRVTICLLVAFLVLFNYSCTKLTEENPVIEGEITLEKVPDKDSLPASWGKLISVSSLAEASQWVQLWFEDEEGTIRMVAYNIIQNRLTNQVRVIPRN